MKTSRWLYKSRVYVLDGAFTYATDWQVLAQSLVKNNNPTTNSLKYFTNSPWDLYISIYRYRYMYIYIYIDTYIHIYIDINIYI